MTAQPIYLRKILLLYRTFDPSVHLCGYAQFHWLTKQERCEFRHKRIKDVQTDDLNWAEFVAFVRGDALLDERIAALCHRAGKIVLYILDDDLFNVPAQLGSGPYYRQKSVKRHIDRMMQYSDALVSPSPKLLNKYGSSFQYTIPIIEPSLFSWDKRPSHTDGRIYIGFAGSFDRSGDIDLILSEALTRIKERYKDQIVIEFFGVHPKLIKQLSCTVYPYQESYESYQKMMQQLNWDIGLAPLPDTEFHSCKHYNKLVEYAGFGICGIYSDVPPYSGAVQDQYNGLLCANSTDAWVNALTRLIEDSELRQRISHNCLQQAHTVFSVPFAAEKLADEMAKIQTNAHAEEIQTSLIMIKAIGLISWYIEKLKKYGWKTPVVAAKKIIRMFRRNLS